MHQGLLRLLLLWLLLITGCGTSIQPSPPLEQPAVEQESEAGRKGAAPDDPGAVQRLEAQAAKLTRDRDGFVVEVSFRGKQFDPEVLVSLARLQRLRSLLFNDSNVTDADLEVVGKLSSLRNLDLRGCKVSNVGVERLVNLEGLKALRFSGKDSSTSVDDGALGTIASLPSLKVLALDFLWVSDSGLMQLQPLAGLEELYLAGTLITGEGLQNIKQFSRLRRLRIAHTQVTNDGLAVLEELPNLEDLDLSENALLSDEAMAALGKATSLKKLNLWRVAITDAGLADLARLVKLVSLNLDNTQISDTGLQHLKKMQSLEILHLGSTAVSDAGLTHLEPLGSLKDLNVTRTGVTAEGVSGLQEKLPGAKIQLRYMEGG